MKIQQVDLLVINRKKEGNNWMSYMWNNKAGGSREKFQRSLKYTFFSYISGKIGQICSFNVVYSFIY